MSASAMSSGDGLLEVKTYFQSIDVNDTGSVGLAKLFSLVNATMSAEDFLKVVLSSNACFVCYDEFLKYVDTGIRMELESAISGLASIRKNADCGSAGPLRLAPDLPSRYSSAPAQHWSETSSTAGSGSRSFIRWNILGTLDVQKRRMSSPTGALKSLQEAPRPRALLAGATGLLGREVLKAFEKTGWVVCGTGWRRAKSPIVQLDMFDTQAVEQLLDEFQPHVLINCVAERRPDKLEGHMDYAMKINAELPRIIAELCKERSIWLVYMSTNYVFDGKAAPYAEDSATNPVNTYGVSKLAGEVALREEYIEAAILRVPLLYGPSDSLDESSVTQILKVVRQASAKIDHWQQRYPTFTTDLAQVIEAFASAYVKREATDTATFSGIFHWQAQQMHTKFTMAKVIADVAGIDASHLVPVDTAPSPGSAPRPQFEEMLCTRMHRLLGVDGKPERFFTDFKESISTTLAPFLRAPEELRDGDAY